MLPRPNRLRAKRDVERVSRAGRPVAAPDLTVRAAPNRIGRARVTVVAGLKVSKHATVRNRAKRLIREAIRRNLQAIHPNADIVVYTRASIVGKPYREVSRELRWAFTRCGLLCGPWEDNAETQNAERKTQK